MLKRYGQVIVGMDATYNTTKWCGGCVTGGWWDVSNVPHSCSLLLAALVSSFHCH